MTDATSNGHAAHEALGFITETIRALPGADRYRADDLLGAVVAQTLSGGLTWSRSVTESINRAIEDIDGALSRQLAAIMHAPEFLGLEGRWRGLHYLVFNTETDDNLKIKVLNTRKQELRNDFHRSTDYSYSQIFKKVEEGELGTPGGEPFGVLIGDYEFTNHPIDISLLSGISSVAAAAMCPFVSAVDPTFLGFESWTELDRPRDLAKIFDSVEYVQWRSFRESEASGWVFLTLPRVMVRLPYGNKTRPVTEFDYQEAAEAETAGVQLHHESYCWMNAAYAMGANIGRAFKLYGWCSRIRGVESGGGVEDLPLHRYRSDDGDLVFKSPAEIAISDRRADELDRLGFLPLCSYKNTDFAVFFEDYSCQKAKIFDRPEATANSLASSRLSRRLVVARFGHYVKKMCDQLLGRSAMEIQTYLNEWLQRYVDPRPYVTEVDKARKPLAKAQIVLEEFSDKSNTYSARITLTPRYQFDELAESVIEKVSSELSAS